MLIWGLCPSRLSPIRGENVKPAYGGEDEAFLRKVVSPIYDVIVKETARSRKGISKHSQWRNYDVLNEYFWLMLIFSVCQLTGKNEIFHTPEGVLSSEQGVYIAESLASKNTKQAKGCFRVYDNHEDVDYVNSNNSVKREPASVRKKESGKSTKKTDKRMIAKEEAHGILLREEASTCQKVMGTQKNLCLMLRALREEASTCQKVMVPVFTHSQLSSPVCMYVLLRSSTNTIIHFQTHQMYFVRNIIELFSCFVSFVLVSS
ncbi:protein ILITYHIA-like isoform X2 [Actinidia eriantha]|uniref:protein ILITYHIA-like isoform X2 n=1 Tax=Actinidia eriantha TaxID=165200 RepID=UPI002584F210|nr:protein ILITYHIA-like isoform X2 [Actinidia eriantha]